MTAVRADFKLRAGDFDLEVRFELESGVLILFGPSGSGKSLTVSALAGLVTPSEGRIELGGRVLYDSEALLNIPARQRRIGYVPQHHSLFPFKDVAENVAFGLPRARRRRDDPAVVALLEELDLAHLATSPATALSGGERQRVALARALAPEPTVLLLDEPFASIDRDGRHRLRRTLRETLERHGTPAVFVTHSPGEALALGDRLVRYERGRTTGTGAPGEILAEHGVVLEAEAGAVEEIEGGRVRVTLRSATLEGPADPLRPDPHGRVRLRLPAGDE